LDGLRPDPTGWTAAEQLFLFKSSSTLLFGNKFNQKVVVPTSGKGGEPKLTLEKAQREFKALKGGGRCRA
jgi:hypothetical protein